MDDTPDTRAAAVHAVGRLARNKVDHAERAWQDISQRLAFTASESGRAAALIAHRAAATDHPRRLALLDAVPTGAMTPALHAYRIREAIAARDWQRLAAWTEGPPQEGVSALRWRYWHARALDRLGRSAAAAVLYEALATERDYYGFLAADHLQLDYQFNNVPVAPQTDEYAAVMAMPGVARAHELYLTDRRFQARRELYFELGRLERRKQEVLAAILAEWGWHAGAIAALGRAQSWDDLALRFPLRHAALVSEYGQKRQLEPARIMAIMRSESAFVTDARSGAGALGLMQLMPATARETAQQIGLKYKSSRALYEPRTNIALGSAYLTRVIRRFGGSFVMASAAYNAGPHRVKRWQKAACIPAAIWIDTIPFTETRRYVRRALFYTAIYQWRMGREVTRLADVTPPVPARGAAPVSSCST